MQTIITKIDHDRIVLHTVSRNEVQHKQVDPSDYRTYVMGKIYMFMLIYNMFKM